jgi:hypothetical protein
MEYRKMSIQALKIKLKSLAAEAQIIRFEENKLKRGGFGPDEDRADKKLWRFNTYTDIRHHRLLIVRKESRISFLAYAFMRGKRYDQVESKTLMSRNKVALEHTKSIAGTVCRFSNRGDIKAVEKLIWDWMNEPAVQSIAAE